MALPTYNGIFNLTTNLIEAPSTSDWSDLTTWDAWNNWSGEPAAQLTWLSEQLDLESSQYFNLQVSTTAIGTVSEYTVYVSQTGSFAGEETSTTITPGDTNIEGFYGQYVVVLVTVDYDAASGPPSISDISATATSERLEIVLTDINSADLNGGLQAKELVLPRKASKVVSMFIQPHQPGGYFTVDYVAPDYVETAPPVFANIAEKDRLIPKVSFATYEGIYTNSVFDIKLAVLPEQYCDTQGNILVR
mgnify:FL=1|tara:strand:+ start:9780 stop:10523 length:744 start_codon:yes stop_codon:yes gene_type:complete